MVSMSRLRLRKKWKDSYACRRQFFLFVFFCFGLTALFKVLKVANEEEQRAQLHRSVSQKIDKALFWLNEGGNQP